MESTLKTLSLVCNSASITKIPNSIPQNTVWVEHVQTCSTLADLHEARIRALQKVKTPYWCFVDDDDPLPQLPKEIPLCTLLYGQESVYDVNGNIERHTQGVLYRWLQIAQNPLLIHKAIANTEYTQRLLPLLPKGTYLTEFMIFAVLSQIQPRIDPSFHYHWWRRSNGVHQWPEIKIAIQQTREYLLQHGKSLVKSIT